jgi:hypothetical protein
VSDDPAGGRSAAEEGLSDGAAGGPADPGSRPATEVFGGDSGTDGVEPGHRGVFRSDLEKSSPTELLDIDDQSYGSLAEVPFWALRAKLQQVGDDPDSPSGRLPGHQRISG